MSTLSAAVVSGAGALVAQPVLHRALRPWAQLRGGKSGALVASSTVLAGLVGVRFAEDPIVVAWWWAVLAGCGLAVIDVRQHRLPRMWVAALGTGGLALLSTAAAMSGDGSSLLRACAAAGATAVVALFVYAASGGGFGFGDVTLLPVIAFYTGWLGWRPVATAFVAGVLLLGALGALAWVTGRRSGQDPLAAGPALLLGGLCSLAA